jgi:hypothetical protein
LRLLAASITQFFSKLHFFLCGKTQEQTCIVWYFLWHMKHTGFMLSSFRSWLCFFFSLNILLNILVRMWSLMEDDFDDVCSNHDVMKIFKLKKQWLWVLMWAFHFIVASSWSIEDGFLHCFKGVYDDLLSQAPHYNRKFCI